MELLQKIEILESNQLVLLEAIKKLQPSNPERLLNVKQICEILHWSPRTFYNNKKEMPLFTFKGKTVCKHDDLMKYIQDNLKPLNK